MPTSAIICDAYTSITKKKKKENYDAYTSIIKKENVRASNSLFQGYAAFKRVKMIPTILKAILKFCTTKKLFNNDLLKKYKLLLQLMSNNFTMLD